MRTPYEDLPGRPRMNGIFYSRGGRGFMPGCDRFVFRNAEEIR